MPSRHEAPHEEDRGPWRRASALCLWPPCNPRRPHSALALAALAQEPGAESAPGAAGPGSGQAPPGQLLVAPLACPSPVPHAAAGLGVPVLSPLPEAALLRAGRCPLPCPTRVCGNPVHLWRPPRASSPLCLPLGEGHPVTLGVGFLSAGRAKRRREPCPPRLPPVQWAVRPYPRPRPGRGPVASAGAPGNSLRGLPS